MSKIGNWVVELQEREQFEVGRKCFETGNPAQPSADLSHEDRAAFHLGWISARNEHFDGQEPTKEESEHDIAARNAGVPCLTIWKDGSFVHHGFRDAEIAEACEPNEVLLSIRLDTMDAI